MKLIGGKLCVLLCVVAVAFGLTACATTSTTESTKTTASWKPGAPDAITSEHYNLAVGAIDKRAKTDAQAALNMLRDDASRMRTNAPDMMAALARLYGVSNAIDAGEWEKARTGIEALHVEYGQH